MCSIKIRHKAQELAHAPTVQNCSFVEEMSRLVKYRRRPLGRVGLLLEFSRAACSTLYAFPPVSVKKINAYIMNLGHFC